MLRRGALLIALVVLVSACSAAGGDVPARAGSIVCHAAYRSTAGGPIEREETLELADEDGEGSLVFREMEFHAFYSAGIADDERSLRLKVTLPRRKTAITTQLYQLSGDSGPANLFVGGHGFTGLTYAYSEEGAELQFWCTAE